ncbi:hypothetical protein ACEUAX_09835 [Aeromonas veronii]|uniref:hypothetical protein n=1 Tax=Aeromonas veronii TaxID=654 RepID=UPI0038D28557
MNIELIAAPLKKILEAELALGNSIQEVSDWQPKCQLLIVLKRSFNQRYELEKYVEFAELDISHYWKAEYRYRDGLQCLACLGNG